jgi:hypothetical protein
LFFCRGMQNISGRDLTKPTHTQTCARC